jgi:hypothetical protein
LLPGVTRPIPLIESKRFVARFADNAAIEYTN